MSVCNRKYRFSLYHTLSPSRFEATFYHILTFVPFFLIYKKSRDTKKKNPWTLKRFMESRNSNTNHNCKCLLLSSDSSDCRKYVEGKEGIIFMRIEWLGGERGGIDASITTTEVFLESRGRSLKHPSEHPAKPGWYQSITWQGMLK